MSDADRPELDKLRAQVLALFPAVLSEVGTELAEARRDLLARSRERLAAGRYLVVVCGEFRRGKSSLLNALVERRALFPVDVDVTTSVVSTLEWSPDERGLVHLAPDPSGVVPEPLEVPLDRIADYVTEQANPANKRDVLHVAMQAPFEQLRSGLVLADTPGAGSLNAGHTAATRTFLSRADAILFVCSAAQPLSTIELEFLAEALARCPIVLTAVTMVDKVVDPAPVIAEARSRIAEVAGVPAAELLVVGVSSLRKRRGMELGDVEMVEASGFPALEAELWEGLGATCGAAQLGAALDGLGAAVADAESPVLNELAALQDDDALVRIDAELKAEQAKARELRAGSSRWRANLATELERNARPARDGLTRDLEQARERFKADVETEEALTEPDALVARASGATVDAVARADAGLQAVVADVAQRYARTTSVTLTASGIGATLDTGFGVRDMDDVGDYDADDEDAAGSRGIAKFRHDWGTGMAVGGAAGALAFAASLVFPPIGAIGLLIAGVGTVLGWFGGKKHREQMEQARREKAHRRHLYEQVLPKLDSAKRAAERSFADKLRDVTRSLTDLLDEQLTASAESLSQSTARLHATRKRTADERTARRHALQERVARYSALHATLDDLNGRVAGLARNRRGV
jgi:hypothetical protein